MDTIKIECYQIGTIRDWQGNVCNKRIVDHLQKGDVVRVQLQIGNRDPGSDEFDVGMCTSPYFKITERKGGHFWGKALNWYDNLRSINDDFGMNILLPDQKFVFCKDNICEIPLLLYPNKRRKKLERFQLLGTF